MIVEVDQSIKVEQTHRDTAVAFSDGIRYTVLIPARVKREAINRLRAKGKYARHLYLWLFVLALYHLLKSHLNQIAVIIIDTEYKGNEENTRALLLQLFRRESKKIPKIVFQQISRKSSAHKAAIAVVRGDAKPDRILTTREFMKPITEK